MSPVPPDQCSPYPASRTSTASNQDKRDDGSPHQRGTDDADDASEAEWLKAERLEAKRVARRNRLIQSGFPVFVRYDDLVAAGFVGSWTQLLRMIDDEGFPAGTLLSANVRAWRLDEVEVWLAERPSARKSVPPDAVHPRVRDKRRAAMET
jgi:hypothetical protein